ncbi:MAG: sensor histidine kinase [Verrucomicrobiota bacterium]
MKRWFRLVFFLGASWCVAPVFAQETEPIRLIGEVRVLTESEAEESRRVVLEGQAIRVHPAGHGFFLHDGQSGIYVEGLPPGKSFEDLTAGDLVRIEGYTKPGHFTPSIQPETFQKTGRAPLPEARPFYLYQIFDTNIDSDWVSVMGRLISVTVFDRLNAIVIGLDMNGITVYAQLPKTEEGLQRVRELMFRLVRFDAVAGSVFNTNRQLTGRIFFVNSAQDLIPLREGALVEDMPSFGIHELMRVGARLRQSVQTEGVVTYVSDSELFLRGKESSLLVVPKEVPDVSLGDTVVVGGLVWPQPVSPAFRAIEVERMREGDPPEPKQVVLGNEIDSGLNFELIQLEAELVDIGKSFEISVLDVEEKERVSLLCRSGPHLFEAYLPEGETLSGVEPGALLSLTGICRLEVAPEALGIIFVDGLSLQLRGLEDVKVLKAAPFWTPLRLVLLLLIALVLMSLFVVWVFLLRRTVERQTSTISSQIERQTISDERQRIARELHDNLEQGLAAMAIQLRGAYKLLQRLANKAEQSVRRSINLSEQADPNLQTHLKGRLEEIAHDSAQSQRTVRTAQEMLAHCSEEARASILDLRGGLLERMDLPSALDVALELITEGSGAQVTVEVLGSARKLRKSAERNLLLIARESATNAIRHGEPKRIDVSIEYRTSSLRLTIIDDGVGFDPYQRKKAGHFGLIGMKERAVSLKGKLEIKSEASKGTSVVLLIPDTMELERP